MDSLETVGSDLHDTAFQECPAFGTREAEIPKAPSRNADQIAITAGDD
jgi:hypothetical protein